MLGRQIMLIPCLVAALILGGCHEAKSEPWTPSVPGDNSGLPEDKPDDGQDESDGQKYFISSVEEFSGLSLAPGDVVVWKNGTYNAVTAKLKAKGAEGSPVVLKAETPGKVVFTGASSLSLSGAYFRAEGFAWRELDSSMKTSVMTCAKGSDHCAFENCLIDGSGSAYTVVDSKWVSLYGTFNEIANCTFIDKRNMGCLLVVWMEDGIIPCHTIRNNYFTRPYTHYDGSKAKNGQESIRIGTSDYSMNEAACKVYGNHFYCADGERAEIISNKSCGNVYYDNLFEDSVGTLTLRHGNNCSVRNNIFMSNGKANAGGVRIIGENHTVDGNVFLELTGSGYNSALCLVRGESDAALSGYWTVKNAMVRNNVFVNCKNGILVNYSGRSTQDSHPLNSTFVDNVLYAPAVSSYTAVEVIDTPSRQMHWLTNVICGGVCKGISLGITDKEPEIRDYSDDIDRIKINAGKQW